jgi:hypothetical protein
VTIASRAEGQKSQYWAKAQKGEVVHDATSTVDPAPDRAGEAIVSANPRADMSSSLLDNCVVWLIGLITGGLGADILIPLQP